MKILILLDNHCKYLTYKIFKTEQEMDLFIDKIHPLMMANINRTEPLQKKLEVVKDDYFIYASSIADYEVINLDET
jgi:hypothetical protein